VDPQSDLVSGTEMSIWKRDQTTQKILRYLTRWREQVKEHMADGNTIDERAETTSVLTVEASAKAQVIKDILTLAPKDIAEFYGLAEPQEQKK
jgi:hypothetical protein